jgi:dimethylamine/trimethylamine dehydrogenase
VDAVEEVLALGVSHAVIATGCRWRRDGYGRSNAGPIPGFGDWVRTPDDVMDGAVPTGHVVIFDDDAFYVGSVMAEAVVRAGGTVTLVTPDDTVASWSGNTLDYRHIQKRLHELGVVQVVSHNIVSAEPGWVRLEHGWSGASRKIACDAVLSVTARLPEDGLLVALEARRGEWEGAGLRAAECIGDAHAPGLIAHAVYAGHRYAQEFDAGAVPDVPFRRHLPVAQG